MISFGVKVEFPRGFNPSDEIGKHRLRRWAPARGSTVELARWLRRRVKKRGDTPDRFRGYPGQTTDSQGRKRGHKIIASRYPLIAQPDQVRSDGSLVFKSSRDFHDAARVKRGSFDVAGGMWAGMSVVLSGTNRARIAFRGRSQGYSPQNTAGKYSARGTKVSNAKKAAAVFESVDVNVLKNTHPEFLALSTAIRASMAETTAPAFGIGRVTHQGARGPSGLVRAMIRAINRNARTL